MNRVKSSMIRRFGCVLAGLTVAMSSIALAQTSPAAAASAAPAPMNWTTAQDHQNMLDQLGIKALRAGPNGTPGKPNSANYDEAKANPYPNQPDALNWKNGKKVKSVKAWWKQRRP